MAEVKGAGPEKQVLIFKAGEGFEWIGMTPDKKPSMLAKNVPQQMVNMRLVSGEVKGRGGQRRIASHSKPITGIVDFFTEITGGTGPQIWPPDWYEHLAGEMYFTNGANGQSGGPFVGSFNQGSGYLESVDPDNVVNAPVFLYGTDTCLITKSQIPPFNPYLIIKKLNGTVVTEVPFASTPVATSVVVDSDGDILIAVDDGSSTLVYIYDGATCTLDNTISGKRVRQATRRGDTSVFIANSSVHVRDAAGVWTDFAVPAASFANQIYRKDVCDQLGGVLYLPSSPSDVAMYAFDGATFTEYTITDIGIETGGEIWSVATIGSNLYFIWSTGQGDTGDLTKVYIGMYDGASWSPYYKDMLSNFPSYGGQISAGEGPYILYTLKAWGARLVVQMFETIGLVGTNTKTHVVRSTEDGINSTWREIARMPPAPDEFAIFTNNFIMNQLTIV